MNSLLKKSPPAKDIKQIQRPQPPLLQQRKATPVAPPPYRPQAKAVLPKMNNTQSARGPVAPPVYNPQPTPKVLQLKLKSITPATPGKASRHPVAPPVYRPQQSSKGVAQAKRVTLKPGSPVIQRRVMSKFALGAELAILERDEREAQEQANRALQQLMEEEEAEQAAGNQQQQPKPKGKKKKRGPRLDKAARERKEEKERKFEERERERAEEHEVELAQQVQLWRDIEIGTAGSAAYIFGLLAKGYATLDAAHRCFLSAYEMQGGIRFENRFGLSRRIRLTDELKDKYFERYNVNTADCVVHFHCAGNGFVRSFGIKYLATERVGGDNLIVNPFFLDQARPYVGDIDGDNVEGRVGAFD